MFVLRYTLLAAYRCTRYRSLQRKEASFVSRLWHERFVVCSKCGKDVVRLLQEVANVPEIQSIWTTIMHRSVIYIYIYGSLKNV